MAMATAIKGQIYDELSRKAVEGQNDRGEEEEKSETGSRNSVIVICSITNCREGAWEEFFSQIAETQDFMLNLEEREEGEGEREVASDNELNSRTQGWVTYRSEIHCSLLCSESCC
ncbi:hypothetical protein ACB092_02G032500 [Castanea dentata]